MGLILQFTVENSKNFHIFYSWIMQLERLDHILDNIFVDQILRNMLFYIFTKKTYFAICVVLSPDLIVKFIEVKRQLSLLIISTFPPSLFDMHYRSCFLSMNYLCLLLIFNPHNNPNLCLINTSNL